MAVVAAAAVLQGLLPAALFTDPDNHCVPKKWDSFSLTGAPSEVARKNLGGWMGWGNLGGWRLVLKSEVGWSSCCIKKKQKQKKKHDMT